MYSFENDYSEGACEEILAALIKTNFKQEVGYGNDSYCLKAKELIKKTIEDDNVDIHFVPGGTPCNILAISLLKPYEAVICVESGHINVHETGAIEHGGHKILTAPGYDGKISAREVEEICLKHTDEHMVKPRMVFISNSTEFGTIYYKDELEELSEVCHKYNLYLYLDGARLGNALTAEGNDLTIQELTRLVDMYYIGGTKNGALLGEAMVIRNDELKENFRYSLKQNGSMLAKARVVGIEFATFFENNLYFKLARHANKMAKSLKYVFTKNGIPMYMNSPTNQIFPVLPNNVLKKIEEKYRVTPWGAYDENHTIVRFVCSWATREEAVIAFYEDYQKIVSDSI